MPMINAIKEKQGIVSLRMFHGKPHIFKKLLDPLDISYILEIEVSRRMKDCDQIYKVFGLVEEDSRSYLVSEYIEGTDFTEVLEVFSEQKLLSIVCQVLFLIYLLHVSGISHNDLHCSNIRIQSTELETINYIHENRVYSIPSHGVKAVIIDFGSALVINVDKPARSTGQIFIGDSFMRLDMRYDMCRFLKSFADCITWRTQNKKCKKLTHFIEKTLTTPLELGVYGVPAPFVNIAPRLFNKKIKATYSDPPTIWSNVIALLNAWPWEVHESAGDINETFNFIKDLTHDQAVELKNDIIHFNYTPAIAKLAPLVFLWEEFKINFSARISEKIMTGFNNKIYIHSPIFVVDWILTGMDF